MGEARDQCWILRRGKRIKADYNRLRLYNFPEGVNPFDTTDKHLMRVRTPKEEEERALESPKEIQIGDMSVLRLTVTPDQPYPFQVCKVLKVRGDKTLLLRWYGNNAGDCESVWRPGWLYKTRKGRHECYQEKKNRHFEMYTTDTLTEPMMNVTCEHLVCFGFELLHNGRLPRNVKEMISSDAAVDWSLETDDDTL